jgi:hypothetical protein
MARKMKKFSAGGAQGKYDRRMADIKKDFEKDSKGKSGKALEVLAAKRAQRTADAEDDRAKRMGTDRTATRAAERAAESNLTKTRKYGAPKAVTTEASVSEPKIATIAAPVKSGISTPASKPAAKPVQKSVQKPAAAKPRDRYYVSPENRRAIDEAAKKEPFTKTDSRALADLKTMQAKRNADSEARLAAARKVRGGSNFGAATTSKDASAALLAPKGSTSRSSLSSLFTTSDAFKKAQEAKGYGKAKGGKIMKYAKGGATPPKPSDADRARSKKHLDELKKLKPTAEEGKVAGSANRSEGPGYKKGGKAKGKSFAATKFGAAMMKKSADTKGRAMPKFAKGGSIDGCAVKGKTKTSMVKMKNGGSC